MTSTLSGRRPSRHPARGDWPSYLVAGLLLVGGAVLGAVAYSLVRTYPTRPIPASGVTSAPLGIQTGLDPINLQLAERVEDGIEFLKIIVSLVGVMMTLLAIGLGLSIWRTMSYAVRLLNEQITRLKSDELDPLFEKARATLEGFSTQGVKILLDASSMLFTPLFEIIQDSYRRQLKIGDVDEHDIERLLETRETEFGQSQEITQYLLVLLSRDPEVVQDGCHKLSSRATERQLYLVSHKDFVLDHVFKVLPSWPPGSRTWAEIRSLIEAIKAIE